MSRGRRSSTVPMPTCGTDKSLPSVPRSKGCLTCVARKTRCDGRRPTCRSCANRNQVCQGYRREELVFLSEGWRAPGVASLARSKTKKNTTRNEIMLRNADASTLSRSTRRVDLVLHTSPAMDRSHLHIAFFLASFGSQPFQARVFLDHLFRNYFSLASSNSIDGLSHSRSISIPAVHAVDALALAYFGVAHADNTSVQQSFSRYGRALQAMSDRLAHFERTDSSSKGISEDEWQHLAFFCLVMAFWEMKMSPASTTWQRHLQGLAGAIAIRDKNHAYSESNRRLLATSRFLFVLQILSKTQPNCLPENDWQRHEASRSAWLVELESSLENFGSDYELYTSIDYLFVETTTIASIMAQFNQLLAQGRSTSSREHDTNFSTTLIELYSLTESILTRNEVRLVCWSTKLREMPLLSWLAFHPDVAADPVSNLFWSSVNEDEVRSHFETVLYFDAMREYHFLTLLWTIAMALHLLMSDMLGLMGTTKARQLPFNAQQKIEDHRVQLAKYASQVLQAVCYATLPESRAITPFLLATAFQLSVVVLERECKSLRVAGGSEYRVRKYESLKGIALQYLNWAMQDKITIGMDVDLFNRAT